MPKKTPGGDFEFVMTIWSELGLHLSLLWIRGSSIAGILVSNPNLPSCWNKVLTSYQAQKNDSPIYNMYNL